MKVNKEEHVSRMGEKYVTKMGQIKNRNKFGYYAKQTPECGRKEASYKGCLIW